MATSTAQRAGIWIIAIALTVGTLAGFVAMIIAPKNEATDAKVAQEQYEKDYANYLKDQEKAKKANKPLKGYEATVFKADTIKSLKTDTLVEGKGAVLKDDSKINANYFGWTADGSIFDSTNKNGVITPVDFGLDQVIEGWTKGLTGVKVGSIVKLSIPAEQAYGAEDKGDGRPFGPLMFIVEVKELK